MTPVSVASKLQLPEYKPDNDKVKKLVDGVKSLDLLKQSIDNEALTDKPEINLSKQDVGNDAACEEMKSFMQKVMTFSTTKYAGLD